MMRNLKKVFGLAVLLFAAFMVVAGGSHAQAATNINNFTINSYRIDYDLGRDDEGRSSLKTVETIDALFPDFDQNHGIERAIPNSYDGHPTSLKIASVTDGSGLTRNYSTYESNNNLVLRIGDADKYVRGLQRYVITYSQRDVTRYFDNTKSDEFYWDTNGTEWAVPISTLSVNLRIQETLKGQQTGKALCYLGSVGSTKQCELAATDNSYSLQASSLSPGENATLAVGFKPQTFATYKQTLGEKLVAIWIVALAGTSFIAFSLIVWFIIRYYRKSNRTAEYSTIVPEYVPPKDSSLAASAAIYRSARAVFSAQLIDFAVRRYITIYQTREKSFFRKAEYELEIIKDISDLKAEEQELLNDIFDSTAFGSRLALAKLKSNSSTIASKLSDNPGKLNKNIKGAYALRAKDAGQSAWFKRAGFYTLAAAILTLSPSLLVAAIVAFICAVTLWPLTDKGLALYHYLEGLKLYIGVAEAERIKMLQGPDTAEKIGSSTPIDTNDTKQMVKLYEKVLPYAIMFGQETAWNDRLGHYYESLNQSPSWLVGSNSNAAFNAAIFSSSLNNFSTAATYSNPSSSSSGGSGGGGSSGGGGGGGGGGGW